MDVYPESRGGPPSSTLLALAAAVLALAAIGWAVGLFPGRGDDGGLATERPALTNGRANAVNLSNSDRVSTNSDRVSRKVLGAAPVSAIADCNRLAAQVQGTAPDLAAGVSTADEGGADEGSPRSTTEGLLAGLRVENGRTQSARSAYRDCMIEHGLSS